MSFSKQLRVGLSGHCHLLCHSLWSSCTLGCLWVFPAFASITSSCQLRVGSSRKSFFPFFFLGEGVWFFVLFLGGGQGFGGSSSSSLSPAPACDDNIASGLRAKPEDTGKLREGWRLEGKARLTYMFFLLLADQTENHLAEWLLVPGQMSALFFRTLTAFINEGILLQIRIKPERQARIRALLTVLPRKISGNLRGTQQPFKKEPQFYGKDMINADMSYYFKDGSSFQISSLPFILNVLLASFISSHSDLDNCVPLQAIFFSYK